MGTTLSIPGMVSWLMFEIIFFVWLWIAHSWLRSFCHRFTHEMEGKLVQRNSSRIRSVGRNVVSGRNQQKPIRPLVFHLTRWQTVYTYSPRPNDGHMLFLHHCELSQMLTNVTVPTSHCVCAEQTQVCAICSVAESSIWREVFLVLYRCHSSFHNNDNVGMNYGAYSEIIPFNIYWSFSQVFLLISSICLALKIHFHPCVVDTLP